MRDLSTLDPLYPDLLVILGGPVGVYEEEAYPYLLEERRILKKRLDANLPTLGICLGAQQIASTLGSPVKPGGYKEIGFFPLKLNAAGEESALRHLAGVSVLHWHGDQFEVPKGALNLASTPLCAAQAFALGSNILGLQFHPEIDACAEIEPWLTGHAVELSSAGIDPRRLRKEAAQVGHDLRNAARKMFTEWIRGHK